MRRGRARGAFPPAVCVHDGAAGSLWRPIQLANKAAAGDVRAILAVVALAQGVETRGGSDDIAVPLDEADRRVLDRLIDRVREKAGTIE